MKKRGFTLIEMLIVIVIIGILAGALIPRIGSARDKANDTARKANLQGVATALIQYTVDGNTLPGNAAGCYALTTAITGQLQNYQYAENVLPKDPAGNGVQYNAGTITFTGEDYVYCRLDGSHFALISRVSAGGNATTGFAHTGMTFADFSQNIGDTADTNTVYIYIQ